MSSTSRRHSVSGDHHRHHRSHRYDDEDDGSYQYGDAYYSRDTGSPQRRSRHHGDEGYDADPYRPRRGESRRSGMNSSRRHSPDRNPGHGGGSRGRTRHTDDDYDPRDKYYLSGDENAGWRSQSQPRPSNRYTREGDDYFGSRHHRSPSRGESRRQSRTRHAESRSRYDDDNDDDHNFRHHQQSRGRRGAPPMPRRQSSSAPPPSSRKYPPSASNNRHNRHRGSSSSSKYPPSSADNRKKGRSASFSGSGGSRNKDGKEGGGRSRSGSKGKAGLKESAFGDVPWSAAARCALEAGTMAALKAHDAPGAWLGTKGAQVATAAVGAALIDGFVASRNPGIRGGKRHAVLRQVTNAALGNMIMNPAGKTVEQKKPDMKHAGMNFARNHMHAPHRRH